MPTPHDFYNTTDPIRWGRNEMPYQFERTAAWLERLELPPGIVLELGCGMGAMAKVHVRYVGLDYALPALAGIPGGVRRVNGDMQNLPFRDRSVAFAFSWAAIEHVPEPALVMAEVERVMAPGGVALLAPAWHCRPWAAEGLTVRSYGQLTPSQKIRKALIPVRENIILRALAELPRRAAGELRALRGAVPLRFGRLTPNLDEYLVTDSDAFSSLDPHATALYFASRGWSVLSHPSRVARLRASSEPVVVQKPR